MRIRSYLGIQREKRAARKYSDVAYIEGYVNALTYLDMPDDSRKAMPLYYVFGCKDDLRTLAQYKRACKNARTLHRAAYLSAVKLTKQTADGVVLHHRPFLL
jgi:hypothetical protein